MRRGRVVISKPLLRMLLNIPDHLVIGSVYETPEDTHKDTFSISVTGRFCPEVAEGTPAPEITLLYSSVKTGETILLAVDGLDT